MFMKPMLSTEGDGPFDDERFLFEPLIHGQRLQLAMSGGVVKLLSRHGYDVTRQYPELHNVPLRKPADVVFDGQLAYVHPESGKTDFEVLQHRYRLKGDLRIREAQSMMPLRFFVFDILYFNGIDLRVFPLYKRKRMLFAVLEDNACFKRMVFARGTSESLHSQVRELGLQGVIGKSWRSLYSEGRSEEWIKVKT
jgi:DNA ligase-1